MVSRSCDLGIGLSDPHTHVARAALTIVRVYALYNRNPLVLWVLGGHLVFSISACLLLVRVRCPQSGILSNVLYQRWVGILGNGMGPGKPPPTMRCVPYRTDKQCVPRRACPRLGLTFLSTFIRHSCHRGIGQLSRPDNLSRDRSEHCPK